MRATATPLGVVARGLLAGAVGTAAMDLLLYRRDRQRGGTQSLLEWEFSAGVRDWDGAAAPAQVGRRLVEGLFQVELAPRWARPLNNLMHWGYGLAWGAQYGVVAASTKALRHHYGIVLGPVVFSSGYVVLPLAGLYRPIWEYDAPTLARDFTAHLVYGLVTAESFRLLARRRGRRGRGPCRSAAGGREVLVVGVGPHPAPRPPDGGEGRHQLAAANGHPGADVRTVEVGGARRR